MLWAAGFLGGASPARAAESGFAFLRSPVSARSAALGGSGTAFLEGAAAYYSNPAGVAPADARATSSTPWGLAGEAAFTHHEAGAGLRRESLVAVGAKGPQAVALSFSSLYSESIELRDEVGLLQGHYGLTDLAVGATYAAHFGHGWRGGLAASFVDESFAGSRANTWKFDVGVRHDLGALPGLQLGGSLLHLGAASHFTVDGVRGDPVSLPTTAQLGAAYHVRLSPKASLLVTAEGHKAKDDNATGHFGGEFSYDLLALRAGYRAAVDVGQVAAGVGVHAGRFQLDYAFSTLGEGLGETHRFEVGVLFGL